jgi:chromosome segregation ATPase
MRASGMLDLHYPRLQGATALMLLSLAGVAWSQQPPAGPGIYTCTDDRGRRLTSDRPIAECASRDQQILNRDGSVKGVHPPVPTAEERAEREARDRKANAERMAQMEAVRRDKNLLARYRDEPSHRKAREAALDTVRLAIKATEARLKELQAERKPLDNEAEFYKGKRLPPKLKGQIEANDTAMEAQREAGANQQSELNRVNRIYDTELVRLQKLWAGAVPGSLGPITPPSAVKPAASVASR